jgi:hypothetical protein
LILLHYFGSIAAFHLGSFREKHIFLAFFATPRAGNEAATFSRGRR